MSAINKAITFVMAPESSYYSGHVMRRVTADVGNGIQAILSETTTGMELDEFQEKYPNEPVGGVRGVTLASEVSYMNDDQLSALGLQRVEGGESAARPERVVEDLTPSQTYPAHQGYGWYLLSNGNKAKGKTESNRRQDLINEGTPDPYDKPEPKESDEE